MITKNELNEMKNADLLSCNAEDLVDIRDIKVDKDKSQYEKLIDFIEAIKNPYLFKVGSTIVKVKFADDNNTFQKRLENIISAKLAQ